MPLINYAFEEFYYVFLGALSFIYLICSIRTKVCLVAGTFILVVDVGFFSGVYFNLALGNESLATSLRIVSAV